MAYLASNLLVLSAVLGFSTINAVSITADSAIMRREQEVHLYASGQMEHVKGSSLAQPEDEVELLDCDKQLVTMDEGVDACDTAKGPWPAGSSPAGTVKSAAECKEMAEKPVDQGGLGLTAATGDHPPFNLNDYNVAVWPAVKGCYVNTTSNEVHFNPTATDTTGLTLTGKKICLRSKFTNGTANTNSDSSCTGESTAITTYEACLNASLCSKGGGVTKLLTLISKDNTNDGDGEPSADERPQGCYTDVIGRWGFNGATAAPSGTINGTSVCLNVVSSS